VSFIIYKLFFKPNIKLVHWCFISLPGESIENKRFIYLFKSLTRKYFDAFLVYSKFSKKKLIELNDKTKDKIYVATNVGNTNHFLKLSESISEHKSNLRKKLKLRDSFTVLYLGTLDKNKKPDILLKLASINELQSTNFLLLGNGSLYDELLFLKSSKKLENVYLPGKVHDTLAQYIKASDVLLVPGRGGIVISEAMAFSLPIVVNKCDGTEYDLIENNINGLILESDELDNFKNAILYLQNNPSICTKMGQISKNIIINKYNIDNMANSIIFMISDLSKKI
jgi:glycosyltransferase involved in cell wall biosynthesis